jgi:glycosyltransferase involved in cell wall biosynthesis
MIGARVSVIVPVRDGELYIEEAIDSILAQTRVPDQLIVVDDGSTDSTAERVEGYGDSIALLRREHGGVGVALNRGLDAADGALISFLDADDLWTPRKLELQCAAMDDDPALDMVFGHVEQFISEELSDEERSRLRPPAGHQAAKMKGTMLVRRAALDRVGPFPTQWKIVDFVDWYSRAQELGLREEMLGEVVLLRRLHRTNIGRHRAGDRSEYARAMGAMLRRRRGS